MEDVRAEPRLLLPALKPFYDRAIPLSWLVIRVAVAWNLLVHVWGKIQAGPTRMTPIFANMGFEPGGVWYWAAFLVEGLGGIGILLGLFSFGRIVAFPGIAGVWRRLGAFLRVPQFRALLAISN